MTYVPSFNLVREPWIPVLIDGECRDVSLLEAFGQATRIAGLAENDPLETVAILRQVLLPVLLDAVTPPVDEEEWVARWESGGLPGLVTQYLERHFDRFDLFDPNQPFAQVGGLAVTKKQTSGTKKQTSSTIEQTRPVSVILAAVASGNNVPIFNARTHADPPSLTPAQAGRAVLAAHCWDTAGIKSGANGDPAVSNGKTMGNPTGPVGQLGFVMPLGRNLAETLLLNTPIMSQGLTPGDCPQWRTEPATAAWTQRSAHGLLDLLTWQARRIRLLPELSPNGAVVVRRVVLSAGDRLDPLPIDVEPHTAWRQEDKPGVGRPPVRPIRHQSGRSAWRGMEALLCTDPPGDNNDSTTALLSQLAEIRAQELLPSDFPLQVLTVGVVYGSKAAVVEDVVIDRTPLPLGAFDQGAEIQAFVLEVVQQAERLRLAANSLSGDLRRAAGADDQHREKEPHRKRGQRLGDLLMHSFDRVVQRMLIGLQREPGRIKEAEAAWRLEARRLALEAAGPALNAAPPSAFLGREGRGEWSGRTYRVSSAEARYRAAITRAIGPPDASPSSKTRQGGPT